MVKRNGVTFESAIYSLFSVIIIFILNPPEGLFHIVEGTSTKFLYMQIFMFCIVLFYQFIKGGCFTSQLWLLILYYFTLISSSYLINHSNPYYRVMLQIVALSLFISIGYRYHEMEMMKGFIIYYFIIAIIQILCQFSAPEGMFVDLRSGVRAGNWLMGIKNYPIRFLLPGIVVNFIYSYKKHNNIFSFFSTVFLGISTYIVLVARAATGMVGLAIFIGLVLFFRNREIPKIVTITNGVIGSMVAFALIYFVKIQYYFDYLIIVVLQKDMTFTSRQFIWDKSFEVIRQNFLFGVGDHSDYALYLNGYAHAHQYWLQIMLSGGVVCFVIFFLFYFTSSRKISRISSPIGSVIIFAVISFMIMGIDEALKFAEMMLPMIIIGVEEYRKDNPPNKYVVLGHFTLN